MKISTNGSQGAFMTTEMTQIRTLDYATSWDKVISKIFNIMDEYLADLHPGDEDQHSGDISEWDFSLSTPVRTFQ